MAKATARPSTRLTRTEPKVNTSVFLSASQKFASAASVVKFFVPMKPWFWGLVRS